ncbi:hypothetical protein C8Q79DRAFT_1122855 [Trametes meyenii]|nr:hypothetical protein C8Q79DRAFT_1122855 [Trametes meyenii]
MAHEVRLSSITSRVNEDPFVQARKSLLAEIETHLDAILRLKGRINDMSPTIHLPPEILSEIFTLIAVDNYNARRWYHCGSSHAYKWIALAHVCRAWRDIALNTPRLWSRVVITRPDAAMSALARSKKAPLWLTAVLVHPEDFHATILRDTILSESSRLKELSVRGPPRLLQMLSAGWTAPATALEKLTLSTDFLQCGHSYVLPGQPAPLSAKIFSGEVPHLQHLEIHRIAIDWCNPLFCPSLRSLEVESPYDIPVSMKDGEFRDLLVSLERMESLENLYLNKAIPCLRILDSDHAPTSPAGTAGRPIALPSLRRLDLHADATECAGLLRHLSLPINVQMVINGRNERGADDLVRVFSDQLGPSTPLNAASLAPSGPTQVCVKGWRSPVDIRDSNAPRPDVQLHVEALSPFSRSLQTLVTESTFFTQLHYFEIQCASRNWSWSALFGRMPELQILSVIGHPEYGFLPALSAVRDDDDRNAGIVPLPYLHTLEFDNLRFGCPHSDHESQYLEKLIDYLVMRCNHGVPISRLVLRSCVNATEGDVTRLRDIVPEVQWDRRKYIEESVDEHGMDDDEIAEELEWMVPDDLFTPMFPEDYYDDGDDLDLWMIPFGF